MKIKIVTVTLKSISFVQDDYLHTVAYARDVKDWMKQWTVANNFLPICTAVEVPGDFVPPKEMETVITNARTVLVAQHLENLHSLFPLHTKAEREYSKDFEFSFDIHIADNGGLLAFAGHASNDRHSILKGSL